MKKLLLTLALALCAIQPGFAEHRHEKNSIKAQYEDIDAILDKSLMPPDLAEFQIRPEFIDLLHIDSKTYQNELEYTAAKEKKQYYFDKDGQSVDVPATGGHYREILGTSADGKLVAQDFYQDSGAPQTAPFILIPGKENDLSTDGIDGRLVWYNPEGKVTDIAVFSQGKRQGGHLFITEKGLNMIDFEKEQSIFYSLDGKLLSHISHIDQQKEQEFFYYHSGKIMLIFQEKDGKSYYRAWNEAGKEVKILEIAPQFMDAYELRQEIYQSVLKKIEAALEEAKNHE